MSTGSRVAAVCALAVFLSIQGSAAEAKVIGASDALVSSAQPLAVAVSPHDPHIRYVGRFDTRQAAGPRCAWSASEVELRFSGPRLNAVLADTGDDAYEVVVDGKIGPVLTTHQGTAVYDLVNDADTPQANQVHTVVLVKRTEPLVGTTQFLGFQLPDGQHMLSLSARSPRRIEVIGDSISCGYGNEGKDQNEHFSPTTEDAYLSYGSVTGRALDAEYTCIAWSGRTMWPTNTVPEIYGLTLPDDPTSVWDFARWVPDAVVINLGTNDFRNGSPNREDWTAAYERFIARVRKNYPQAAIYCASGPMMSDSWPPGQQALSTLKAYLSQIIMAEHVGGDLNVHLLTFTPQSPDDGYGADWHPSIKTDAIMSATLTKTLRTDLGWSGQKTAASSQARSGAHSIPYRSLSDAAEAAKRG